MIGLGCVGEFEAGSQLAFASRGLSFFRWDFLFFGQSRARFQTSHTVITVRVSEHSAFFLVTLTFHAPNI